MSKRIVVTLSIISILMIGVFGAFLGAGNNGYSQKYAFDCDSQLLIGRLAELKTANPKLQIPKEVELIDSYTEGNLYYHFYFFWADENRIIHVLISSKDNEPVRSILYLEAINEGLTLGNWKVINKDFDRKENLQIKMKFENEILNKLKFNYKSKGNSMFIFWK